MSDDIRPGDVVVCVNLRPDKRGNVPEAISQGRTYRVSAANTGRSGEVFLTLCGIRPVINNGLGYRAWRFRKLNDGEEDAELIARIRACKPMRQPVGATCDSGSGADRENSRSEVEAEGPQSGAAETAHRPDLVHHQSEGVRK